MVIRYTIFLYQKSDFNNNAIFVMQLTLFDELFEIRGRQALLFYYQDAETPVSGK